MGIVMIHFAINILFQCFPYIFWYDSDIVRFCIVASQIFPIL